MAKPIINQLPEGFLIDEPNQNISQQSYNQLPEGFTIDEPIQESTQDSLVQGYDELPEGFTIDAAPDKMAVAKSVLLDKIAAPKQESFQEANRRRFGQYIEGVPKGFGNAFVGGVQFATDVGESAARGIEGAIYGDTMDQETFGDRLAGQVKKNKAEQAELPAAERAGIFTGELAPYLGVGAQSGLVKGGALAGAAMGLGQQREEAGLGGRIMEGAEGAALGAAGGGIIKGVGAVAKPAAKGISNMVKRLTKGQTGEEILGKIVSPEEAGKQAIRLAAREGRESLLPDIAGDEVSGLTRMLAKTPGSKNIINTALNNRTATSSRRVSDLINKNVSSESYFGNIDDLVKARAEISAPLYRQAYKEGAVIGEKQAIINQQRYKGSKEISNLKTPTNATEEESLQKLITEKQSARADELNPQPFTSKLFRGEGSNVKRGRFGSGTYSTPNKELASSYGKVKELEVSLEKPYYIDSEIEAAFIKPDPQKIRELGYDGIVVLEDGGAVNQVVDFGIKSTAKTSKTSPQLKELLDDERITSALKTAQKDFGITAPSNSIEALHGARQVLDDTISTAMRAGENNKARAYLQLKSKLNETLYKASPTLREADNTFSGFSALKGAQEEGLNFNKLRPEELKRRMAGLTAGEKDAFKIGVRENLMKTLGKTTDSASAARRLFSKPESRQQLKTIFGSQERYADFSRKMMDEIRIFDAKNRILGGSRTDINLADEGQIIDKIAGGAVSPKLALVGAVVDSVKKRYIGLNETNAKELAKILVSKEKSIDALRRIAAKAKGEQKTIINQFLNDVTPAIIGKATTKTIIENN